MGFPLPCFLSHHHRLCPHLAQNSWERQKGRSLPNHALSVLHPNPCQRFSHSPSGSNDGPVSQGISVCSETLRGPAPSPQRARSLLWQLCYLPSSLELDLLKLPSRGSEPCGRCINGLITCAGEKFTPQSRSSFEVRATISAYEMLTPRERKLTIPLSFPGRGGRPSLVGVGGRSCHWNKCDGQRSSQLSC